MSFLLSGCEKRFDNLKSIYQWINDPGNGLVKTKNVEGIKLTVKYLPAEFLALKEAKEESVYNAKTYDSLFNLYKSSHTFLLSIASVENENSNDPMYKDLEDFPEYKKRAKTMNFDMQSYLTLRTSTEEFKPTLAIMENTYSLKGQRNIYVVFTDQSPKDEMKEDAFDFVFNDEIFQTGQNHFIFEKSDITGMPAINSNTIN